jgi:predicted DCC family thiol-disulfide oxidoreductase YuxK
MQKSNPEKSIILFDGDCNFCNASVSFIIRHNRKKSFHFFPLQSTHGRDLLRKFKVNENYIDSLVLIEGQRIFFKSSAALRIAGKLNGALRLLYLFLIVPRFVRDKVYTWIANRRSSWFKNQNNCILPERETPL